MEFPSTPDRIAAVKNRSTSYWLQAERYFKTLKMISLVIMIEPFKEKAVIAIFEQFHGSTSSLADKYEHILYTMKCKRCLE